MRAPQAARHGAPADLALRRAPPSASRRRARTRRRRRAARAASVTTCRTPKPSTRVSSSSAPEVDEPADAEHGIAEVRGEEAGVDRADARAAQDVDARRRRRGCASGRRRRTRGRRPRTRRAPRRRRGSSRRGACRPRRSGRRHAASGAPGLAAVGGAMDAGRLGALRRDGGRLEERGDRWGASTKSLRRRGSRTMLHERARVVDRALMGARRLRRAGALERVARRATRISRPYSQPWRFSTAPSAVVASSVAACISPSVDARRRLDRHRVEVERDERHVLGARGAPRARAATACVRLAPRAREQRRGRRPRACGRRRCR